MLDDGMRGQLKAYFEKIQHPIELVASLGADPASAETRALLDDLVALSDRISLREGADSRRPSFAIRRPDAGAGVRFAGPPMGHEFNSLVLALLHVGGHAPKESADLIAQIRAIDRKLAFETYYSQSCQNCPDVVQALNLMAALNPLISHVAIDGALFPDEVAARAVMAVPAVFLDGAPFAQGRMGLDQILAKLDAPSAHRAAAEAAERLAATAPFEVLVVGGGPAGSAAAIYAARKGIRTGLVAERFGGQVLDTLAIENLISVPHTEGPRLAAALEAQVGDHGIDVVKAQRVEALIPAAAPGGLVGLRLAGGGSLQARAVILAPGARWRTMGVPGEEAYRNKGVAFCPHCDGPLFKGKRVAVIGGGNSGVEAAIDLAGIVAHVTLIEFDDRLRADAVLQAKLTSLANVTVIVSAQTTEVLGDGARVTGLAYRDRRDGAARTLALDGVFVQIGLVPNTDWLKGTVALSPRGEIEIDARGQTSLSGVFAAGDATNVPYKQIVVAMGEGAKASLAAFDYLIRVSAPADAAA